MTDNRLEFLLQTRLHDFRQVFAIHGFCAVVGHGFNFLVRPRNHRRIQIVRNGLELLNHIIDFPGIGHHGFIGRFFAQIGKLGQHFLGGAQVKGRLEISILEPLALHDNCPVNAVLRIEKMHVTGGNEHFTQLLRQFGYLEIDVD